MKSLCWDRGKEENTLATFLREFGNYAIDQVGTNTLVGSQGDMSRDEEERKRLSLENEWASSVCKQKLRMECCWASTPFKVGPEKR